MNTRICSWHGNSRGFGGYNLDSDRCAKSNSNSLEQNVKRAGTTVSIELLQNAALLGTARILRKVKILDSATKVNVKVPRL